MSVAQTVFVFMGLFITLLLIIVVVLPQNPHTLKNAGLF